MSPHPWWGIRIITGPDAWWFGDEQGPYTMDRIMAERVASELNILSNERYFLIKAYRSKPFVIDEHTSPRHASNPGTAIEIIGHDMPHYRYAAAPIFHTTEMRRPPPPRTLLLQAHNPSGPPSQPSAKSARKPKPPRRRSC